MTAFIAASKQWLRVFQLPSYAPDLNPVEGIWAELDRSTLANLAVSSLDELITATKHGLKQLQYRPDLLDGCLAETGLSPPQLHALGISCPMTPTTAPYGSPQKLIAPTSSTWRFR